MLDISSSVPLLFRYIKDKNNKKIWKIFRDEKKNKKTKPWKKLIKPIKILKKQAGLVWFRFYKPKTEPNRTETEKNRAKPKKPSKIKKTEPNWKNRAKLVWTGFCPKKLNRNKSVWTGFGSVWVFLKKKKLIWLLLLLFFDKNQIEQKIITFYISS